MKIVFLLMVFFSGCLFAAEAPQWELGVSIPMAEKDLDNNMKWASEAGFKHVEAFVGGNVLSDQKTAEEYFIRFKESADKNGLKVWSIHLPFGSGTYDPSTLSTDERKACHERIILGLEAGRKLGNYKKVVLHGSYEPIDPKERAERFAAAKAFFKELAPYAKKNYGVQILVEDLPRTCLGNSSKDILALIDGTKDIGICYDVNHLLGEKTEEFARNVGKHIQSLHISDYDEINERHWIPGKGVIKWTKVVDELKKSGYSGPFMFEVTTTPWKENMQQFYKDLAVSWEKIRKDYAAEYP